MEIIFRKYMVSATVEKFEWKLAFKEEACHISASTCCTLFNVCSVHWWMFSTSGDILSTSGGVQYIGGNHDSCGGGN